MTYWSAGVGMLVVLGVLVLVAKVRGRQDAAFGVYLAAYTGATGVVLGAFLPPVAVVVCGLLWFVGMLALAVVAFGQDGSDS